MRVVFDAIGQSPDDALNRSWRPLCEPDADFAQLLTFPLAFVVGTAILVLWLVLAPFAPVSPGFVQILCVFAVLVPLHELTHAATFPQRARAGHSTLAFSPLRLKLCAEYDGTLSRTRLVTSLVMPLLVISLLPVLVAALLGRGSTSIALLSLINALVSSDDLLVAILVLAQVPPRALIHMSGGHITWQMAMPSGVAGPPRTARESS